MNSWCSALFLLVAIGAVACTDPSEPSTLAATFDLTDVDGLPLPATSPPSLGTPVTIVSGTMSLDRLGNAIITEERADESGGSGTIRYNYLYRISNPNIQFLEQIPCPTDSICTMPPAGQIVDNTIRVRLVFPPGAPFQSYDYRSITRF
ncbi:MAG TPA: hypothetical protein VJ840_00775 [Gemmatimonadaceae bacterium]|nr:hypothetical protein [Gemmatimonadaceae bacterium]